MKGTVKMVNKKPTTESHIAGVDIIWDVRYLRQRCSWCGKTLLNYDLERVMVQIPENGSQPSGPSTWPVGAIVRTDGAVSTIVELAEGNREMAERAPDCCVFLDVDVTK